MNSLDWFLQLNYETREAFVTRMMKNRVLRLLRRQRNQANFICLLDFQSVYSWLMRSYLLTRICDLLKWIVVVHQHFARSHRAASSMSHRELRFTWSFRDALAFLVREATALLSDPSLVAQHVHRLFVSNLKHKFSRLIIRGSYVRVTWKRLSLQIESIRKMSTMQSCRQTVRVCFLGGCKRWSRLVLPFCNQLHALDRVNINRGRIEILFLLSLDLAKSLSLKRTIIMVVDGGIKRCLHRGGFIRNRLIWRRMLQGCF